MKKLLILFLLFSAVTSFSQKVVFVIADGIAADMLESTSTPNINKISSNGSYVRAHVGGDVNAYNQTPTISAVGYNSLLTGTWVNKHNVWDNDIAEPNYHYPTIFKLFKEQYPQKKIAVFSSWEDNRTKLVGDGMEQTNHLKVDYSADGFELDTVKFPHDKARNFMHNIDEKVVDEASAAIKDKAPDLSWVYLEYTDDMGHMHGDSPELKDAIEKMDAQMGKLWQAIQYRQSKFKEQWMIVITTDHGRIEATGKDHGGQTPRQRSTWIASNVKFNEYAYCDYPGIVDIMPTIANYLHVKFHEATANEVDGISLVDKVSVAQPVVNIFQNKLDIRWQSFDTTGNIKILLATTNNVKQGGTDEYHLIKELPVGARHAVIDISQYKSDFYKIVLQGKYNSANAWYVKDSSLIKK